MSCKMFFFVYKKKMNLQPEPYSLDWCIQNYHTFTSQEQETVTSYYNSDSLFNDILLDTSYYSYDNDDITPHHTC